VPTLAHCPLGGVARFEDNEAKARTFRPCLLERCSEVFAAYQSAYMRPATYMGIVLCGPDICASRPQVNEGVHGGEIFLRIHEYLEKLILGDTKNY